MTRISSMRVKARRFCLRSNLQDPRSREAPNPKVQPSRRLEFWILEPGASLDLGAWILDLPLDCVSRFIFIFAGSPLLRRPIPNHRVFSRRSHRTEVVGSRIMAARAFIHVIIPPRILWHAIGLQVRPAPISRFPRRRDQILKVRTGGSVMPEGLTASLAPQQLADLIRFLSELGK